MLDLPRFLAKGLIYSFHFSSPACQDLSLLLNPSLLLLLWKLLPVLLLLVLWLSPLPLAWIMLRPFTWVKPAGHMHPCCICLHLPGLLELTIRPPPEAHIPYLLQISTSDPLKHIIH